MRQQLFKKKPYKQAGITEAKIEEVRMPVETEGNCKTCGRKALLADGQCLNCWDGKKSSGEPRKKQKWLSTEEMEQVKNMKAAGLKIVEIALHFSVSRPTIYKILKGVEDD